MKANRDKASHGEASRQASAPRLFVEADLASGATLALSPMQANYLVNVLRLKPGATALVFNGRHGEWLAELAAARKGACEMRVAAQSRPQSDGPDIHYLFAPLKRARLDYVAQKATELGASALRPVQTLRTVAERVNLERLRANAIEAAEQCGVLRLPEIFPPAPLAKLLDGWEPGRRIVFCDEAAPVASPIAALEALGQGPVAVLVGPEGGFAPDERARLLSAPFAHPVSLGPRVMRADTAGVAALALVNAVLGDWR